jgi:hypothetical protein
MVMDRGIRSIQVKICTTSSTTNPTWTILKVEPGLRGQMISTDRLSYEMALKTILQVTAVET